MKFLTSILIGIVVAVIIWIVFVNFFFPNSGWGGIFLVSVLIVWITLAIVGSVVVGIYRQTNKLEKGVIKPKNAKILIVVILFFAAFTIWKSDLLTVFLTNKFYGVSDPHLISK
jgi:hypothetical protein